MKFSPLPVFLAALIVLQFLLPPRAFAAGTNGSIPYKNLDDLCSGAAAVDQSKLVVRVLISSTNEAVHATEIALTIQSKTKGSIPIQIGTNGQILNFPHQEELRRENPSITINQPKGTMNFSLDVAIPVPDSLAFPYRLLAGAADEANKAIKAQAGMLSWFVPKAKGAVFTFPKNRAGKATVEILSASGKKIYTADAEGEVKLKLERALLKENPQVKISEKPESVSPDFE